MHTNFALPTGTEQIVGQWHCQSSGKQSGCYADQCIFPHTYESKTSDRHVPIKETAARAGRLDVGIISHPSGENGNSNRRFKRLTNQWRLPPTLWCKSCTLQCTAEHDSNTIVALFDQIHPPCSGLQYHCHGQQMSPPALGTCV